MYVGRGKLGKSFAMWRRMGLDWGWGLCVSVHGMYAECGRCNFEVSVKVRLVG
jgi:hypothetical protein